MNFNEVLLPEIVLGKRGSKALQQCYKELLSEIVLHDDGVEVKDNLRSLGDQNLFRHLYITKFCTSRKFNTYHVGADFLKALNSIDRDIPMDLLPDDFCAYINFSKNQIKDDDGYIDGAFVYVGYEGSKVFKPEFHGKKSLFITYINSSEQEGMYQTGNIAMSLEDHDSIKNLLDTAKTFDSAFKSKWAVPEDVSKIRNRIFLTIINTVLYIHSENPKIDRVSPFVKGGKLSKNEIRRTGGVVNECSLPIIFVHRLYTRRRVYEADSSFIESFPRWQRCGPGFSRIKLVWVKEHERHYNKEIKGEEEHA